MDYTDLELLILKHIQSENYRPVKPRVIASQLGLPESRRPDVRKAVKRLVKKGDVSYGSNHLVSLPAPAKAKRGEILGVFQRTSAVLVMVVPMARSALICTRNRTTALAPGGRSPYCPP